MLPSKDSLIKRIKELMRETGVSEQELAENTGLSQPVVSRILRGERELRYDEAKTILDYLLGRLSSIPLKLTASDIATGGERLMKVYVDESLCDVARKMFEKGYSQAPIYDGDTLKGVLTEISLLKLLLSPKRDLMNLKVKDVEAQELPVYPHDTPIQTIARALLDYYAVLIEKGGKVEGIVTRADFLRLFFEKEFIE
jgi:predicted transcriptional regulator